MKRTDRDRVDLVLDELIATRADRDRWEQRTRALQHALAVRDGVTKEVIGVAYGIPRPIAPPTEPPDAPAPAETNTTENAGYPTWGHK